MAGENQKKQNSPKVDTKQETEKKGIVESISLTRAELRKVRWPNAKELKKYTVVVLLTVFFFSVALYCIDSTLGFIISKIVSV